MNKMIKTIKQFFENKLANDKDEPAAPSAAIGKTDLICAALMIEVMNSDHQLDERENEEFLRVLQQQYQISEEDLHEISELAKEEAHQATSLYEFTSLINADYEYEQKVGLIENMWRIAFSDEKLDRYEDHLIRKVSELIYVSHSDFIRTKLKVKNND
ncbi:MAG: TerB family tellurite resistance protein [Gammaproteobacteria bacterium]|jgi:uncharacterized tellurite resistance protein B-like protein|nr:TerB family tellurite resistance protein [Gammaproteobacteria bacterium]